MKRIGERLGRGEVIDGDERVVDEREANPFALQPGGQPVVAVHAELEAEGSPGRDSQVAESELTVD